MWRHRCQFDRIDQALAALPELALRAGDAQDRIQVRLIQAAMSAWQGRFGASTAATADLAGPGDDRPLRMEAFTPRTPPAWRRDELLMGAALGLWAAGYADAAWRLADDTVTAWTADPGRTGAGDALAVAAIMAQLDGDQARVSRLTDSVLDRTGAADGPATRWAAALRDWATAGSAATGAPTAATPTAATPTAATPTAATPTAATPTAGAGRAGPPPASAALQPYLLNLSADRDDIGHDTALRLLDDALDEGRRSGERFAEPETLRIRARVWHRAGHYDRGGADLDVAAAVAREQEARSLGLKALNDRLFLTGDHSRLGRLAALLEELGPDGPRRHTETARRILERG